MIKAFYPPRNSLLQEDRTCMTLRSLDPEPSLPAMLNKLLFVVPKRGLEPLRHCCHTALNRACLPIPPLRQVNSKLKSLSRTCFGIVTGSKFKTKSFNFYTKIKKTTSQYHLFYLQVLFALHVCEVHILEACIY